ncbi:MAG: ABC transporter permease subunit [Gemmatimonas sp.]|nr:ABC transporter permease subunit [Gemmatimonas sp.]
MRELRIVMAREFRERVRSRAFFVSTLLLPIFAAGILLVPILLERATAADGYRIAVVDGTAAGLGSRVTAELIREAAVDSEASIDARYLSTPADLVQDSLIGAVRSEDLDGFLVLGADLVDGGPAVYHGRVVTNVALVGRLERSVSEAVQAERLDRASLDPATVAALLRATRLQTAQIPTDDGEAGTMSSMALAYIATFVLYFFILLYGAQVMQSVHEEKGGRIAEVLMSSVSAPQLLAGKVVGVGGAALVQLIVWIGFVVVAFTQRDRVATALGNPGALDAVRFDFQGIFLLLLFALLGFLLYASLYAAVGAATRDMQDAQQFVWILVMPLIIPLILQVQIISDPQGMLATVVGWIPLTAPLAMPLRMGATAISAFEIAGSLLVLAMAVVATSWLAGKIYRIGMLSTGRRASLAEIWKWLRTA